MPKTLKQEVDAQVRKLNKKQLAERVKKLRQEQNERLKRYRASLRES